MTEAILGMVLQTAAALAISSVCRRWFLSGASMVLLGLCGGLAITVLVDCAGTLERRHPSGSGGQPTQWLPLNAASGAAGMPSAPSAPERSGPVSKEVPSAALVPDAEECHAYSERQYWFGGLAQTSAAAAAAAAGIALPVKDDTAQKWLIVGAAVSGVIATGATWFSQTAGADYVQQCTQE